jgi:hypothetical protein
VMDLAALMANADAVTSGSEVWTDSNVLPDGDIGLGGRHFYAEDGYVFGSPHVAIYRRDLLRDTLDKWGIDLHCGGESEMSPETWAQVKALGRDFMAYDTAKVANILFQGEGHTLVHEEHDALVHIGGLSHYLAPPQFDFANEATSGEFEGEPLWVKFQGVELRAAVARLTAEMLKDLAVGAPTASIPEGLEEGTRAKLELVQREVTTMVHNARPWLELTGE